MGHNLKKKEKKRHVTVIPLKSKTLEKYLEAKHKSKCSTVIFLVIRYVMASSVQSRNEALLWAEKVNAKIISGRIWDAKIPFILSVLFS